MPLTSLPDGTSDLTAAPWDDFDALPFVDLAELPVSTGGGAFWDCVSAWTYDRHFNKCIWRVDLLADAFVASDGSALSGAGWDTGGRAAPRPALARTRGCLPPPDATRWIALRELQRKTPAPVGGGADRRGPSLSAHEWTAQYVSPASGRHTAVFGLVVPTTALENGNPRALTMWPFQYPKVRALAVSFEPTARKEGAVAADASAGGVLRYSVLPLETGPPAAGRDFEAVKVWAGRTALKFLNVVRKRCERFDPVAGRSTYVKRVVHDRYVDEALFRSNFCRMKAKYGLRWARDWPNHAQTDPVKFVYEELSIAAYLVSLFELEQRESGREDKVSFVDVGCGNGFLTYLLLEEGFPGTGIDLQKRGIWDAYPSHVTERLVREKIDPETYTCKDVDWILGNHSDELTPWIPAIAARSQTGPIGAARARPRFFILPCCFFDLDGKKWAAGFMRRTFAVKDKGQGRYEMYLQYIEAIVAAFGFRCGRENIRIPSTKYVGLLGLEVDFPERAAPQAVAATIRRAMDDATLSHVKSVPTTSV